jgi:hypothetical protein
MIRIILCFPFGFRPLSECSAKQIIKFHPAIHSANPRVKHPCPEHVLWG